MSSTSTSSRQGAQAPGWVNGSLTDRQMESQLTLRGSKPADTDTQEQVIPSPREKGYYRLESWFMVGLLYRMLKSLIDLVLLRRLEQREAMMPAGPQLEPRPGINTDIGNRNEDCGSIQRSGRINITYKGTATQGGSTATGGLEKLAKDLLAVNARAGHDNKRSSKISDSADLNITHE